MLKIDFYINKTAAILHFFVAVIFMLAAQFSVNAQDVSTLKVDKFIKTAMQDEKIPGISLAVIKDGKIILAKGYGLANVEHQVAVTPQTVFQSGSIGKQFTAAAVMLLVEDGKINLDDKILEIFTDAPAAWKNITVRHLLTHTSGMGDYPEKLDMHRDYSEDDLYKIIKTIPLLFNPGATWEYSNLGYVMLGILIHKITGKFYGEVLRERIFTPLGMTTARIISEADIVPNRAAGYTIVNGALKNQEWVSPSLNTTADGSLYLTVFDMAKWDAALTDEKLLRKLSYEQIFAPVKLNNGKTYPYGFGWSLDTINGHRIVEHDGEWQGFTSMISRYIDDRLTVIVFANLDDADTAKLAHGIAEIYNPALAQAK